MKTLYSQRYQRLLALLVEARRASGLTQQDVANKLKRPQSFVSKYESGERRIDVVELLMLGEAIGFDVTQIVKSLSTRTKDPAVGR